MFSIFCPPHKNKQHIYYYNDNCRLCQQKKTRFPQKSSLANDFFIAADGQKYSFLFAHHPVQQILIRLFNAAQITAEAVEVHRLMRPGIPEARGIRADFIRNE